MSAVYSVNSNIVNPVLKESTERVLITCKAFNKHLILYLGLKNYVCFGLHEF